MREVGWGLHGGRVQAVSVSAPASFAASVLTTGFPNLLTLLGLSSLGGGGGGLRGLRDTSCNLVTESRRACVCAVGTRI